MTDQTSNNKPEKSHLFIDLSKYSLKADILNSGNKNP